MKKGDKIFSHELGLGEIVLIHDEPNLFAAKFERKETRILCEKRENGRLFTKFDDKPKQIFFKYE